MLKRLIEALLRLLRRKPAPPEPDPYARVRVPLKKGPHSRSGAVALEEPEEN